MMETGYLEEIEELYEREEELVIGSLSEHDDLISPTTFYRHFESVEEAARLADIEYERYRKVELVCKRCGSVDERPPSFIEKYGGRYKEHCEECNTEKVECEGCSSTFQKPTFRVKNRNNHYCSWSCYKENYGKEEDSNDYYAGEWYKIRKNVIDAFGNECFSCGRTSGEQKSDYDRGLEVHHITPIEKYKEAGIEAKKVHSNAGLAPLCSKCHGKITHGEKTLLEIKIEAGQ